MKQSFDPDDDQQGLIHNNNNNNRLVQPFKVALWGEGWLGINGQDDTFDIKKHISKDPSTMGKELGLP